MKNIGYADTKNKLGGGPSPLKGIFSAAVGAAKGTTKKKSKTKAKNVPKRNKGEGVFEYTGRLAKHAKSSKSKGRSSVKDVIQSSRSGESSGDAVLAYTPLYSKCKGKDCDEGKKKKKEPKAPKSPRIPLADKWKNRGEKPPKKDKLQWGGTLRQGNLSLLNSKKKPSGWKTKQKAQELPNTDKKKKS